MLVAFGAVLVDADVIVRELQTPGQPVFEAMLGRWGIEILDTDGTLDRARLAARVFADPDELAALNSIVHPAVGVAMQSRRESLAGTVATVILDIPLLVESGHRELDGLVVVDLAPNLAIRRLVEHRGFSEADAEKRIASQATREERLAVADLVIDNNGPISDLAREVDRCWEWIMGLDRPPLDRPLGKLGSRLDEQ